MKNKSNIILALLMLIGIIVTIGVAFSYHIKLKGYDNSDFVVQYDSTWKVLNKEKGLELEHKKSKSILNIQCKKLETNYIDTKLKDIIIDIKFDIEQQNEGYVLIAMDENPSNKYESYSFLYEKGMEQVLVNIYKKDNKLVIAYYEANSEYYDIVLDSVDIILDSLEIISGEKVN